MTKRQARKVMYAILALDDLSSIVDAQLDANQNVAALPWSDKKKIVAAAQDFAQQIYKRAGEKAVTTVLGAG